MGSDPEGGSRVELKLEPTLVRTFIVSNVTGLLARPASKIVRLTTQHTGWVGASTDDEKGDGKSMMHLMRLGVGHGMRVQFEFAPLEKSARRIPDEVEGLLANGFGEL